MVTVVSEDLSVFGLFGVGQLITADGTTMGGEAVWKGLFSVEWVAAVEMELLLMVGSWIFYNTSSSV